MENLKLVKTFWQLFDERKYLETRDLFHDECRVYMESSREVFEDIDLYLQMNCDYPGTWRTLLKRCDLIGEEAVSVAHIFSNSEVEEHYVTTYYKFKEGLIFEMREYWGVIEGQPQWRKKYSKSTS